MNRLQRIEGLLTKALAPTSLSVVDESHHHAGHSGAREGGETHYNVTIEAEVFKGKTRVACHRLVNEVLKDEFDTGLHALAIKTGVIAS
jgi:BolA family transcriptional regulator, general stress-responsive regulator